MRKIALTIHLFLVVFGFAQNTALDSLTLVLKSTKQDTNRVNILNELAFASAQNDQEVALDFVNQALLLAKKLNYKKGEAFAEYSIGRIGWFKIEYDSAIVHYNRALILCKSLLASKNEKEVRYAKKILGMTFNNIAAIYSFRAIYPNALEYYLKAIKLSEEVGDQKQASKTIGNIAIVYYDQKEYTKAKEYFLKGLKKAEELGDKQLIGRSLGNIGNVYMSQLDDTKAMEYYFKGLKISEEVGDKVHEAMSLEHIASIYYGQRKYSEALEYYLKGLKIVEAINNKNQICSFLSHLGRLNIELGKYKEAEVQLNKALEISKEIGGKNTEKNSEKYLASLYEKTNRPALALEHFKNYIALRDTIFSQENSKKLMRYEMDHEYEKKKLLSDTEHQKEIEKQQTVADEKNRRQKVISYSVGISLVFVLILAFFIYRSNRQKQKANQIITLQKKEVENQKNLIEEKHKEITDSINYAERIQRSFLASKEFLDINLKDYFVFFQPKDIVSGDFYWAYKLTNGNFVLVTGDSTGHGVPGAIMSLLNVTSIETALKEGYINPSDILNSTRKTIIERLKKDGSMEGGKDGMDVSLICFDFVKNKFTYAAANNPVLVVRNGEIIELTYDKMPVGKHQRDSIPFNQFEFNTQKGDVIYTLTDGMLDQFGGPKGKKFLYKQLKELLVSISNESMEKQKQILSEALNNWKANLEQLDDVTIIGVRV